MTPASSLLRSKRGRPTSHSVHGAYVFSDENCSASRPLISAPTSASSSPLSERVHLGHLRHVDLTALAQRGRRLAHDLDAPSTRSACVRCDTKQARSTFRPWIILLDRNTRLPALIRSRNAFCRAISRSSGASGRSVRRRTRVGTAPRSAGGRRQSSTFGSSSKASARRTARSSFSHARSPPELPRQPSEYST